MLDTFNSCQHRKISCNSVDILSY